MSITLMSAVWKKQCTHTELIVLLALADHADDDGLNVRPSKNYLAWKTNYSSRQIQRLLKDFRERGILTPVRFTRGGRGQSTHYKLDISSLPSKPDYEREKGDMVSPFSDDDGEQKGDIALSRKGDIALSRKGDIAMSPESSYNIKNHQLPETPQSETPPKGSKKKKDRRAPRVTLPRKVAPDQFDLKTFLRLEPEQAFDADQFIDTVPTQYKTLIRESCQHMPRSTVKAATTRWFLDRTDKPIVSADWYSNWTRYVHSWWQNHGGTVSSLTSGQLEEHVKSVKDGRSSQKEI